MKASCVSFFDLKDWGLFLFWWIFIFGVCFGRHFCGIRQKESWVSQGSFLFPSVHPIIHPLKEWPSESVSPFHTDSLTRKERGKKQDLCLLFSFLPSFLLFRPSVRPSVPSSVRPSVRPCVCFFSVRARRAHDSVCCRNTHFPSLALSPSRLSLSSLSLSLSLLSSLLTLMSLYVCSLCSFYLALFCVCFLPVFSSPSSWQQFFNLVVENPSSLFVFLLIIEVHPSFVVESLSLVSLSLSLCEYLLYRAQKRERERYIYAYVHGIICSYSGPTSVAHRLSTSVVAFFWSGFSNFFYPRKRQAL